MKYIDHIAYPIMIATVYVLISFINWDFDPDYWDYPDRVIWVCWGMVWGWALQQRINKEERKANETI